MQSNQTDTKSSETKQEGPNEAAAASLGIVVDALQRISAHADKLIGHGEFRRLSLERITKGSRAIYKRRKVNGIPGCSHLLIYKTDISACALHYSLDGDIYLRVVNA